MTIATPAGIVTRAGGWPSRHPGLVFVSLILLAMLGALGAARLTFQSAADATRPVVHVRAELPGIDPATVEDLVTRPLEAALRDIPHASAIEARTRTGSADLYLRFETPARRDRALPTVQRRLGAAAGLLPSGMDIPSVQPRDLGKRAASIYVLSGGNLRAPDLWNWMNQVLLEPLREMPQTETVTVEGAGEHEIVVQPDMGRLAAFGLSFDDLIHAVQREREAPPPRRGRRARRPAAVPASAEAIAARAVILPSGEPIALAELATITTVRRDVPAPRLDGSAPALRLLIYPRTTEEGPYVAERVRAHVAWLRANGLIPDTVQLEPVFDQAQATRLSLRRLLRRTAMFVGVTLVIAGLTFGIRRAVLFASAWAVWLPLSAGALWLLEFALTPLLVVGLIAASVLLALLVLLPRFRGAVAVAGTAAAVALGIGLLARNTAPAAVAFGVGTIAAMFVGWLLAPWSQARQRATPLFARLLPARRREQWRPIAALLLIGGMVVATAAGVRALARVDRPSGAFVVRLAGEEFAPLLDLAQPRLRELRAADAQVLAYSGDSTDVWRLQLDPERIEAVGITLPEVGRALAIAQEGIVVGQTVHNDIVYNLRLRLPRGAAGTRFERLLLRGEQRKRPALYLQHVGTASQESQPRERLRLDGKPAIEIVVRTDADSARAAFEQQWRDRRGMSGVAVSIERGWTP